MWSVSRVRDAKKSVRPAHSEFPLEYPSTVKDINTIWPHTDRYNAIMNPKQTGQTKPFAPRPAGKAKSDETKTGEGVTNKTVTPIQTSTVESAHKGTAKDSDQGPKSIAKPYDATSSMQANEPIIQSDVLAKSLEAAQANLGKNIDGEPPATNIGVSFSGKPFAGVVANAGENDFTNITIPRNRMPIHRGARRTPSSEGRDYQR